MLLDGINHVAVITDDIDRFTEFYVGVFDAVVSNQVPVGDGNTLTMVDIGPKTELNVFSRPKDMAELPRGSMLTHGPIDHMGLQAASKEAFDEIRRRLMKRGATD